MERMTEELLATIEQLKEENKKLKEEMDIAITHNLLLIEENKKLRAELEIKNLALKQAQEGSILI